MLLIVCSTIGYIVHIVKIMDTRKIVGNNVRKIRTGLGLSQEELADLSGVHRTYISGVERGIRNPTVTILANIAGALKVKTSKLLEETK